MKTRVLALALCAIFGAMSAAAQAWRFEWIDQPQKTASKDILVVDHYARLTNVSSKDIVVKFYYYNSEKIDGHGCNICFGDLCYNLFDGPDDPDIRIPTTLVAGETSEIKTQLITCTEWDPETQKCPGKEGTSTVGFRIYDSENPADSVRFDITFVIGDISSVRDLSESMTVAVGPNPASDVVTLSAQELANVVGVDIYSNTGTILRSVGHNGTAMITVPVDGLASGSYHVVLTFANGDIYRQAISVVR